MPIYEYVCKACGTESEITHKISDPPARKCPKCGKSKLEKMMSAAGFRLAGGGWYESDFKSGNKKNIAGEKPESKPAAPATAEKPAAAAKPAKPAKKEKSKTAAA